ncbi:hypothetical protein GDO81_004369 [Engystomops pustulosus]|uniref:Beta-microseminoprotein n=2 Tax=Engystomops pustulosus TaxID=76066 RepID=A0AAV6ZS75_ENGPU|nr:hypothetical protein GDO81_004369 [Engystomops pustulosus]
MYWKSAVGSVVVFLLACSFLKSLCNGACMNRESRLSSAGEKPDGCMDGDIKRALNTTWFKAKCITCSCDPAGELSCCSRVLEPILNDRGCTAILNETSCTYIIKRKGDSSEPCESWASM